MGKRLFELQTNCHYLDFATTRKVLKKYSAVNRISNKGTDNFVFFQRQKEYTSNAINLYIGAQFNLYTILVE